MSRCSGLPWKTVVWGIQSGHGLGRLGKCSGLLVDQVEGCAAGTAGEYWHNMKRNHSYSAAFSA